MSITRMTDFKLSGFCNRRKKEIIKTLRPTIGDKIVETLYLKRVTSENKRIRTPPLSPPFKVGVFVVFYRKLEQGPNIVRRGWGRKAIFPPFEVHKT